MRDILFNCFCDLGFTQLVNEQTHMNSHGNGGNILDLIFSNDPLSVSFDNLSAPLGTSDHSIVHFTIFDQFPQEICYDTSPIELPVYYWSAGDYQAIGEYLATFDWTNLFSFHFDVDSLWSEFKRILRAIILLHVPHKNISHNKKYRPRTYPRHIRKLLTRKAAIWRKMKDSNRPDLILKYRKTANDCKLEITKFDTINEDKLLKSNNLGAFYKFMNNKLSRKSGIAHLRTADNKLVCTDSGKADLLNSYFESVFVVDDGTIPVFKSRLPPNSEGISDIQISPSIIEKTLNKLKTNSAAGPGWPSSIFFP